MQRHSLVFPVKERNAGPVKHVVIFCRLHQTHVRMTQQPGGGRNVAEKLGGGNTALVFIFPYIFRLVEQGLKPDWPRMLSPLASASFECLDYRDVPPRLVGDDEVRVLAIRITLIVYHKLKLFFK